MSVREAVVLVASWHCRRAACPVLVALAAWYLCAVVRVRVLAAAVCLCAAEQHRLVQAEAPRSVAVAVPVRQVVVESR